MYTLCEVGFKESQPENCIFSVTSVPTTQTLSRQFKHFCFDRGKTNISQDLVKQHNTTQHTSPFATPNKFSKLNNNMGDPKMRLTVEQLAKRKTARLRREEKERETKRLEKEKNERKRRVSAKTKTKLNEKKKEKEDKKVIKPKSKLKSKTSNKSLNDRLNGKNGKTTGETISNDGSLTAATSVARLSMPELLKSVLNDKRIFPTTTSVVNKEEKETTKVVNRVMKGMQTADPSNF